MSQTRKKYRPDTDFIRVRDMLVETFAQFPRPINWTFERWNYARYFVAPMLGAYGFSDRTRDRGLEAIAIWEEAIGVWEDDRGDIVAVVCPEEHLPNHSSYGMVFFQRRPGFDHLLDDMVDFTEENFINNGRTRIFIPEADSSLAEKSLERGYVSGRDSWGWMMEFPLDDLPEPDLPKGFRLGSMAEDNDLEKRRKIFGLSFRHSDPSEWPSLFAYQELQRAPDYHPELDLYVQGPDGEHVACCIVWIDHHNRFARLEPVGSIIIGMGREVVMEGLRRAASLGARVSYMESGNKFYTAIGFKKMYEGGRVWSLKRVCSDSPENELDT